MRFDMSLIRGSLFVDLCSHLLVALAPPEYGPAGGQALFVGATALSSFGAGLVPAVNSLALCILQAQAEAAAAAGAPPQDTSNIGRLFGALAAIQSVGQMILGPLLFGVVYSATVATYPKAIFATAAAVTLVALALPCAPPPLSSSSASSSSRSPMTTFPSAIG